MTVVRGVVDEVHDAHPDRELIVEGNPLVEGRWDVDRLEQVVQNHVGNAVRHSSRCTDISHHVRVTATADQARVVVHNLGPQIPVELLRTSLFDPFKPIPVVATA